MLAPFLIMFREGIEAALIVGIIASYLKQTGRSNLMSAVWVGIVLATFLCLSIAVLLQIGGQEFPYQQQKLFAAGVSAIAVGVLTWMVFWMKRAGRSIKGELESQVEVAIQPDRAHKLNFALIGTAFFAVAREGLESVVFLLATFQQEQGSQSAVALGAGLGYIAAIAVGVGIYQGGVRLDLKRFFKWTGVSIVLVAAGLSAGAIRAAHAAGIWDLLQTVVFDASTILPKRSILGSVLAGIFGYNDAPTVSESIAYFGYLIPTMLLFFSSAKTKTSQPTSQLQAPEEATP